MSSAIDKYANLIDLLWEKTQKGSVPWEYDSSRNIVKVWGGDSLLEISLTYDENLDELYSATLYNRKGVVLEGFTDSFFGDKAPVDFKTYYQKMDALYDMARRRATGADKALDEFLKKLENDDLDVPF